MLRKIHDNVDSISESIIKAGIDYSYQKELTKELDEKRDDFDETTFLKIVLWKTNRFPILGERTVEIINELRRNYSVDKAKEALLHLLDLKGFDLPMASTVLRFACPNELQIIDKRVYRYIMPEDKLKIPFNTNAKVELYFSYIERIRDVANRHKIPFSKADRVLYQLDKTQNQEIPIDY